MLGERIEKLQKENSQLRKNFSLVEKENLEIKKEIERLQGENEVYRKEREKFGEIKELNSYPLNDLWKEISKTEVPTTEEAIVAIKRLNLEGKVLVSCGYIAAPSREEALDLLRIVKIAKDLKEKNIQ